MRDLFTKPIELLTADDARSVIGWPESLLVEFKQELPSREGRGDAWTKGGNVEDHAKRGIFKEVVALANTSGGHLVLGIVETKEKPPAAARIAPVPRCVELAERLERSAQSIDPPIPRLLVRGIPTDEDGSGIVLFRVPESRSAPHRSIDKECYIRRGTESMPMTMREIQDMTINVGRRTNVIEQAIQESRNRMIRWFLLPNPHEGMKMVGFRITAVPVVTALSLPRLFGNLPDLPRSNQYRATVVFSSHRSTFSVHSADVPMQVRPIMRGVSMTGSNGRSCCNLFTDGSVEIFVGVDTFGGYAKLYLGWIACDLVNALRITDYLRVRAGVPDCEYVVECEIIVQTQITSLILHGWGQNPETNAIGNLSELPLMLPRLSFGQLSDLNGVITAMSTDLHDATGGTYPELPMIEIGLNGAAT
jgi:Putative DNA-binding domain